MTEVCCRYPNCVWAVLLCDRVLLLRVVGLGIDSVGERSSRARVSLVEDGGFVLFWTPAVCFFFIY